MVTVNSTQTVDGIEIINNIDLVDLDVMIKAIRKGKYSKEFGEFEYLGSGAFGTVRGYKEYAIKFIDDDSYFNYGEDDIKVKMKDAVIMKDLQEIPSIPRLYAVIDDRAMIMERVRGLTIGVFTRKVRFNEIDNYTNDDFLAVFERDVHKIVELGYSPNDLHGGNVMICEETGLPKIVDVGLFRYLDTSKDNSNNKNLIYYIDDMRYKMKPILESKKTKKQEEIHKESDKHIVQPAIRSAVLRAGTGFRGGKGVIHDFVHKPHNPFIFQLHADIKPKAILINPISMRRLHNNEESEEDDEE